MNAPTDTRAAWPRSYLFVPGDRADRFDKAWDGPADALILDLEDAVAPDRKAVAREAVAQWLCASKPVWLRINAVDTDAFTEDLRLIDHDGIAGVMLPKAEAMPEALSRWAAARQRPIMPIVESALGMHAAHALAGAPGVARLAFGSIDFQVDMGIEGDDDALLYFRSQLVLASRLGGLPPPVDGVTVAVSDAAQLRHDTERSRRLGFGAKLCIHPQQIALVHEVLSPTPQERDWAHRVARAMEASQGAAVQLDGRMVDRPVLLRALRLASALAHDQRLR